MIAASSYKMELTILIKDKSVRYQRNTSCSPTVKRRP